MHLQEHARLGRRSTLVWDNFCKKDEPLGCSREVPPVRAAVGPGRYTICDRATLANNPCGELRLNATNGMFDSSVTRKFAISRSFRRFWLSRYSYWGYVLWQSRYGAQRKRGVTRT